MGGLLCGLLGGLLCGLLGSLLCGLAGGQVRSLLRGLLCGLQRGLMRGLMRLELSLMYLELSPLPLRVPLRLLPLFVGRLLNLQAHFLPVLRPRGGEIPVLRTMQIGPRIQTRHILWRFIRVMQRFAIRHIHPLCLLTGIRLAQPGCVSVAWG